ncbi:hypothetical protein DZC30_01555 [Comamonas testosteroni]|uniref:Uncharacterized protein n=1 Tax=Comamonas testosteroni TaxID=285 RepID=A0A373FU87_COMTE|nr:hypothetical protein DZC30_01555 [Comamonas testosteroni]
MILERVNFYAKKHNKQIFSKVDDLFDKEQMRQQRAPFDHMLLRTMVRPRDFIKFFELIKQDMKDRKDHPFEPEEVNSEKIECQSIYNAEPAYSEWLVEELRDEWLVQHPIINELFTAIQNNGKTILSHEEFTGAFKKVAGETSEIDITNHLKFMFENSIIGFKIGNSQQWKFKCFYKAQGFIESSQYKVHDGLHRGLNLKEPRAIASNE